MFLARTALGLAVALMLAASGLAQGVNLTEDATAGDCSKFQLDLTVSGQMVLNQDGQKETLKLEAGARHRFRERTLTVEGGLPRKTLRYYDEALARAAAGSNTIERTLPADRRLIVVERRVDGVHAFSPRGPLTREELDTVAEHFHPHALPGLLPGKPVNVGDTWTIDAAATQAACLFDGVSKHELTGKLVGVENGRAAFSIEGTAEGVEAAAVVKLAVTATGVFDVNARRIVELTWKQKDERGEGPVNPASTVDATYSLKREVLAEAPEELRDAVVEVLPRESEKSLRYTDPKGEFQFTYPREWHITVATDSYLILRLIDRGTLIAQATLTRWKKAEPGKHASGDEFRKTIDEIPGWVAKHIHDDGDVPNGGGPWIYRYCATGEVNGLPIVQGFHLVAGPQGHQVVATFAVKPDKIQALGTRDMDLVKALTFTAK
jgi:hypothetical protein